MAETNVTNSNNKEKIRVKFIAKGLEADKRKEYFLNLLPSDDPIWGECRFIFSDTGEYEWLVVYDDIQNEFSANCPRENTLLITTEPSSIKIYESAYLDQFNYVLTGQEDWAIKHVGKIYSQPALRWFYNPNMTYGEILNQRFDSKNKNLSTVCSSKMQNHTEHKMRYAFTEKIKRNFQEMDWYGRGVNAIENKSYALNNYKYHIAIENHVGKHWWTEKLADAFLGHTLPFYYGAPNIYEYFPEKSLITIDIKNPKQAISIIEEAIYNNEYEKRISYISEARKLILEKYNLFGTISQIIESKYTPNLKAEPWELKSRHMVRKDPKNTLFCLFEKARGKIVNKIARKI